MSAAEYNTATPYGDSVLASSSQQNAASSSFVRINGTPYSLPKPVCTSHACVADSPVQESTVGVAGRPWSRRFGAELDAEARNAIIVLGIFMPWTRRRFDAPFGDLVAPPLRVLMGNPGTPATPAWNGKHPLVKLITKSYHRGVGLTAKEMRELETHLERLPGLEKWFVTIPATAS